MRPGSVLRAGCPALKLVSMFLSWGWPLTLYRELAPWVRVQGSCTGTGAYKGPVFGLMLSCCHLRVLINFLKGGPIEHFCHRIYSAIESAVVGSNPPAAFPVRRGYKFLNINICILLWASQTMEPFPPLPHVWNAPGTGRPWASSSGTYA